MVRIIGITLVALLGLGGITYQVMPKKKPALVWADEFEGEVPSKDRWSIYVGNGCPDLCGFGNNELQYYTDRKSNVRIEKGVLVIEGLQDTIGSQQYTSAKLVTKGKGDWKYGRVEVRAKLPKGRGTWPAIWMLPTLDRSLNWPLDGEIDIMEHAGSHQGWILGTIHTQKYNHTKGTQKSDSLFLADASDKFHVYGMSWDEEKMEWFIDDEVYHTLYKKGESEEGWPFDKPFHIILNLAVGGNFGARKGIDDSIWPQTFEIDYVRVYQQQ